MKKRIFYLDDQSYALCQLIYAFPKELRYELVHVQRICDIPQTLNFDLVILDFYLDKDKKTALDIIHLFLGSCILSFSSSKEKNKLMLRQGANYGVQKLKNTHNNQKLVKILGDIFGES